MELFARPSKAGSWWLKALPVGLSLLLLGRSAMAQPATPSFVVGDNGLNDSDPLVNYYTPIWATNFINGANGLYSTFSFTTYSGSANWLGALYHGWHNTLNFTNLGEMDSVTGFNFDTQTSLVTDTEAAGFYNSGGINCGTTVGAIFLNQFFNTFNGTYYGGYGGLNVWATNVFMGNNSVANIGPNGLARFGGNNVTFTNTKVTIQSQSGDLAGTSTANVYAIGQADHNTNGWSPSANLSQFYADAPLNSSPFGIFLFNSVPYFKITASDNSGTNWIVRMIFLQDTSVNVATNVYIVGNQGTNGVGTAHVEWVGSYTDPATGQTSSRYLYLINDYMQGSSTNILKYGDPGTGVPNNFSILTSPTQLALGAPNPAGFIANVLSSDSITNNIYSYVNAQLITTSVSTNSGNTGVIALTNLPGRVEITASNVLNLSRATLSGMNYLLLKSPKHFVYDGRSQIAAAYSDIYLGNTNNSMAVTNLIKPSVPQWSGNIEAWTTRWVVSNTVPAYPGYNFDFRALLVASQVNPVSASQVQDFALYSSNNVVISDVLNITRSLSLNCTNLLLTTNGIGVGAQSLDGELNLGAPGIIWESSVPRLSCLTNYGAIRTLSSAKFGKVSSPYLTLVNSGLIRDVGNTIIYANNFENYGTIAAAAGLLVAQAQSANMTNASLLASGTMSLTASNLVMVGTSIHSGGSLTLNVSGLLTDTGVLSSNFWSIGENYPGFGYAAGLNLAAKPAAGDLLGTTITNYAAVGTSTVDNLWAGEDRGYSVAGYSNNAAIGQLVLDAMTNSTQFHFIGTGVAGVTNAIYVDCLQLWDFADPADPNNWSSATLSALDFDDNVVIYYAQALTKSGVSVAEFINGWNNDHLRWVPTYAGHFSSTNIVYPDGTTNAVNLALATSSNLDPDRDGILNGNNLPDPTPILVPSQLAFNLVLTNLPPRSVRIGWRTIPLAGNSIFYKTDLASSNWLPFTNFDNYYYGNGTAVANPAHTNYFVSPQPYLIGGTPVDNGQSTNVWVFDPLTNVPHFYRIMVQPN